LALVDKYGQVVGKDSSRYIWNYFSNFSILSRIDLTVLEYTDGDLDFNPSIISSSSYVANYGTFLIDEITFSGQPGTTQGLI
jgi:hypothetical protein